MTGKWHEVLEIEREIDTPEKKRAFNERHFTEAARRYDLATRGMSLLRDQSWKRELVRALPQMARPFCVDLASGTGDVSFLLGQRYPDGTVTGIDLTAEMVELAKLRNRSLNVSFACSDMMQSGFSGGSVDIVTGSYALRNAPELRAALGEVHRILKGGGHAAFLDFSKSGGAAVQGMQYWLLKSWCGLWGTLLHGNPSIHAYIADSLKQFPSRDDYHRLISDSGFQLVSTRLFYFGMLELVVVRKPE